MTAALKAYELQSKVQLLASDQIEWAEKHAAIFDANKSKLTSFSPSGKDTSHTIDFGLQKGLKPVTETKWLGVTLDCQLKFKTHRDDVIAKGKKRAAFLSSLSNTRWGIPPLLFKILITSTVHAATDYAAAAWLQLTIPKFFIEKLSSIDGICATRALGALRNSSHIFLCHDLHLVPPESRLTAKIVNTVALTASQPPLQPMYHFHHHTRRTNPPANKSPLHSYFQSTASETFKNFLDIQQPDPAVPLPPTPSFTTLILPDKEREIKSIAALKPSNTQVLVFSDGSCIDGKNTAAAAWCANNRHSISQQLGKENKYGIFEAEFVGLILALRLAKHSVLPTTHQITIVLENHEGVVKDMSHKKNHHQRSFTKSKQPRPYNN